MRIPALCLALGTLALHGEPKTMTARFLSGDSITGQLGGVEDDSLLWRSPVFFEPQRLKLSEVVDIGLPPSLGLEVPEGDHVAIATLTNDDEIRGTLLKVDDKEIKLLTSYAGEMTFRRDMVASLDIEDKPELLYAGPVSLDEWVQSHEGGWTFDRGALITEQATSIAREVGVHQRFKLAFDVEWRGHARFRVYTGANSTDRDEVDNCYELVCQSQYAYLRKRTGRNGRAESVTIGTTSSVREFQEREKVRVELMQDLVSGRIRFVLDGRVVADWREPGPEAGNLGGALHFHSDNPGLLKISRIRMSSWDGIVEGEWQEQGAIFFDEEAVEEPPPAEVVPDASIVLRNGDRIEGDMQGIDAGLVNIQTEFKEIQLPVSRLRSFALRTAEEAADPELCWKPIRRRGDVRAWFADGGHITFQLDSVDQDSIRGNSQTFGEAEFDLAAFNRIEFNLYRPEYALDTR